MKNKQRPLWVITLLAVVLSLSFQAYSPNASAAHWRTVTDPQTGKNVILRKGETLEDYRAKEDHDMVRIPPTANKSSTIKKWVDVTDNEKAKILKPFKSLSKESATCASCHKNEHPGLYQQWGRSKHYGANVGCYECHKADKEDKDAIRHKDFFISVIVSPKDCGTCHNLEAKQFQKKPSC